MNSLREPTTDNLLRFFVFLIKIYTMTTSELKKRLIRKINDINNNELLEEMYRMIETEETDMEIYELSKNQKSAVEEAQEQIKNGKYLADKQADKEIDKWLSK